jgi:hypothetical protein
MCYILELLRLPAAIIADLFNHILAVHNDLGFSRYGHATSIPSDMAATCVSFILPFFGSPFDVFLAISLAAY